MTITKYGRSFALRDGQGDLIAITVYKKRAVEIIRRLKAAQCGVHGPADVPTTSKPQPITQCLP